jgi:hypothetical protein
MDEIMTALIESGYKGYFTFEADGLLPLKMPCWRQRKTFEKDSRLYETPFFLHEELDRFTCHSSSGY